ncbi:hypothetical protein AB0I46_40295 [Streptomyces spectabilis]|uniref:hypothetical protein n=1 Tax=Streptomyces spectabilis TaxID=68270 RepID=UPI003409E96F
MAVELSPDLIEKQQKADAAHAYLREVQKRLGARTCDDGTTVPVLTSEWTDEQHAEWQAAWDAWRKAAEEVQAAIARTEDRLAAETKLKRLVRHPESAEAA